jgi:hypothetical protein
VLTALLSSTQKSLVLNMYGYDDDELNDIILEKLTDEHIYVHEPRQIPVWRSTRAGTPCQVAARSDRNSIAIGHSTKGAISHMKIVIIDGVYTVRGSTTGSSLANKTKTTNSPSTTTP